MKNKTKIDKKYMVRVFSRMILLAFALASIGHASAFAVDFITKKEFDAAKSAYKDYPLKILFKKLKDAADPEKRIIKNTIILKQVFDEGLEEKVKSGVLNYTQTFGMVKSIGKDYLKVWIPETDSEADFFLGIDQIPLVNEHNYIVTSLNISKYAAVIYSLDDRVYQIKISFLPEAPSGLYVKREDGKNIVGWNKPSAIRQPDGYKVFVNEEPFDQVKGTTVKIPRTAGQVDEYYVKAVYKHGDGYVVSTASDTQIDQISAKEIQQEVLAWETYDKIVSSLTPSHWQEAEKLLYENKQLLSENLNQKRQKNIADLIGFFSAIDEGDHLSHTMPESVQKLESALMFYQRAGQKAKSMPAGIDVGFIPKLKIDENKRRINALQTRQEQQAAAETYDRIIAALNPSHWQEAEKLLYDNQQSLSQNLGQEQKQNITHLVAFFSEIDEGDRISKTMAESVQNIGSALMFYQRAEQKAKSLPAGIDVMFIPRLKIDASRARIDKLQTRQKMLLADQTYERVIADLNPSKWQEAEKLLYDNQQFLNQNLDETRKQNVTALLAFFGEIDQGDRISKTPPESVQNLESALMFYQRAEQKAKSLPAGIDVGFIPRLKIEASKARMARLQTRQKQQIAVETYESIIADLNPSQWRTAEKLLYDNQQLLNQNLDETRKLNTAGLIAFFSEVDEGDRLSSAVPESVQKLESALMFYQRAEQKAKTLPADISVLFISQMKISESRARIAKLQTRQQSLSAEQTYDRIIAGLNPSQWQTAEQLLYDNQQLLSRSLDDSRQKNIEGLVAFFREVDEGDRLSKTEPESVQNLESALMFFERAEKKSGALPSAIDVGFIPRIKISESRARIAKLQARQQELLATQTYDRIIAGLNPSQWQAAEQLLYDNEQLLSRSLDDSRQKNIEGLVAFFREIDEGDRFSRATPVSIANFSSALTFYERAEKKAKALPSPIDVVFIASLKIEDSQRRIAKIKTDEQELAIARSAKAESMAASLKPALDVTKLDPKTAVKEAMKVFKTGKYDTSLALFERAYSAQIENLRQSGGRRIKGLLSLPVKHRAEVIFLVEYDQLKSKTNNNEELIREGLQEIYDKIDNGAGLWSIIPESKRKKIKRHIEKY